MQKKRWLILAVCVICGGAFLVKYIAGNAAEQSLTETSAETSAEISSETSAPGKASADKAAENPVIVVDSGHGFFDAGKTGAAGTKEKDINLAIALKLKQKLEENGFSVLMTRENDEALTNGTAPSSKREDMNTRIKLINEAACVLAVSIHQNSFTQASCSGAQVFYYEGSAEGKTLAERVQQALVDGLDPENTRAAKGNSDYYLLKHSGVPMVICECGFLSNAAEEALLGTADYQEKAAAAICSGIMVYMEEHS